MSLVELRDDNIEEVARLGIEAARRGDLMLFPTDTVYGLGGLAFSKRVMEKLQRIKPERASKPTAVLIDNVIRLSQCGGDVPGARIVALAEAFWPGPLTMVWKASNAIPDEFQTADRSLGYRIPDCPYLLILLKGIETPLWATSANLPGLPAPRVFAEIKDAVVKKCDFVVKTSQLLAGRSSTVVDVRGREPIIIRAGTIREEDIRRVWKRA